jgi:tetratricopeptide (TPR) repeat protein
VKRIQVVRIHCVCALMAVFMASPAIAEVSPQDLNLDGNNSRLPKNAATKLLVRVEQPSDDYASQAIWLEGMNGDTEVWKMKFPIQEPINTAKSGAQVSGTDISLWSQAPSCMFTTTQRFSWDGKSLLFKSKTESDPSADAIKKYIDMAAHGTEAQYEKAKKNDDLTIMYPSHYVSGEVIAQIIEAGHKVALVNFRAGKVAAAADRMQLAFDCATDCWINNIGADYKENDSAWDQWLSIFESDGLKEDLPPSKYLPALNDYAYFMQKDNDEDEAVALYRSILKRDPNRTPAYLNIADCLWDLGKKSEAKKYYGDYQSKMTAEGKAKTIPQRVAIRLKK